MLPLRVAVSLALCLTPALVAQDPAKTPPSVQTPKSTTTYTVVETDSGMKVMSSSEFEKARKDMRAAHDAAMKKHADAKKAAAAAHQKFDTPAPKRPMMRVLASNLANAEQAKAKMDALKARRDKAKSGANGRKNRVRSEKGKENRKKRKEHKGG